MIARRERTKIGSLLLAILLVLSMGALLNARYAFAADEGTLIIHKLDSIGVANGGQQPGVNYWQNPDDDLFYAYLAGAEYTAYEIGTFEQSTTSPITTTYTPVAGLMDINGIPITYLDANMDPSLIDTTGLVSELLGTTDGAGPLTSLLDENKVYLIKETVSPSGVNTSVDFIITIPMYVDGEWLFEVNAFPKNLMSNPTIEKSFTGATDSIAYANIGDSVDYTVSVGVPNDIEAGVYDQFVITDTAGSLLARTPGTLVITYTDVEGGTPPEVIYSEEGSGINLGYFTIDGFDAPIMTLSLTQDGSAFLANGSRIDISYSATIQQGDISTPGGISNTVELDLGLTESVEPTTPEPVVRLYSYGIKKVDSSAPDPLPLADASFVVATESGGVYTYLLYDESTGMWSSASSIDDATTFTTQVTGSAADGINSEAILQFRNLDPDTTYYLIETAAPTNYTLLPNPVAIQATETSTDAVYSSYYENVSRAWTYVPNVGYSTTIQNTPASLFPGFLPGTGGLGTALFIVVGAILIGGAVTLAVRSRRKATKSSQR